MSLNQIEYKSLSLFTGLNGVGIGLMPGNVCSSSIKKIVGAAALLPSSTLRQSLRLTAAAGLAAGEAS